MSKIISKKDARAAIENEGAYLHDNGSPLAKFFVVWGNWERWKTIRYDSFYTLREELSLVESRDGTGKSYRKVQP